MEAHTDNLVLIDGDSLVYGVAFSCQKKLEDETIEVAPVEIAYAQIDKAIQEILENTNSGVSMGWLTAGKDNFRNKVAVTLPYKGNRHQDKPLLYKPIRDYLVEQHGFQMETQQEAEDAVGIAHMELTKGNIDAPVVIAGIDKDLLMLAGHHYNFNKKISQRIGIFEAAKNFFTQVLTGDRVDNIEGIKGIGPKKAEKILENVPHLTAFEGRVERCYQEHGQIDRMKETAELLWIRRYKDVPFSFDHVWETYRAYKEVL